MQNSKIALLAQIIKKNKDVSSFSTLELKRAKILASKYSLAELDELYKKELALEENKKQLKKRRLKLILVDREQTKQDKKNKPNFYENQRRLELKKAAIRLAKIEREEKILAEDALLQQENPEAFKVVEILRHISGAGNKALKIQKDNPSSKQIYKIAKLYADNPNFTLDQLKFIITRPRLLSKDKASFVLLGQMKNNKI